MMKKIIFTGLIMIPFLASAADAVPADAATPTAAASTRIPIEKCDASNYENCEADPVHQEIRITEKDASGKIEEPWGTVFINSIPRKDKGVLHVDLEVKVLCKNETQTRTIIKSQSICGYPNVRTETNIDSYIFTVIHDPLLNITITDKEIQVQYDVAGGSGSSGYCGGKAFAPLVATNPCTGPTAATGANPRPH